MILSRYRNDPHAVVAQPVPAETDYPNDGKNRSSFDTTTWPNGASAKVASAIMRRNLSRRRGTRRLSPCCAHDSTTSKPPFELLVVYARDCTLFGAFSWVGRLRRRVRPSLSAKRKPTLIPSSSKPCSFTRAR